jgi:DNA-binding MarR family transcriptional regulator
MLIVLRARGSRGGGLLMHHLWREADGDASGVFMLTVQQVREYGSSTPDDPAGVQQMQTIVTATALPPVFAALMATDHAIGSHMGNRLGPREGGASLRAAALLVAVAAEPGRSTRHYAELLEISKPAVTRMSDCCEAAGLLTRSTDPNHGRRICITLTFDGRVLAKMLSGKGA